MTEYDEWQKIKLEKEEAVKKIEEELIYIKDKIGEDLRPLYDERNEISVGICKEKNKNCFCV